MDRRESLKLMSLITGGAMFAGLSTAVLQGCTAPEKGSALKHLSPEMFADLQQISEVIIPSTDTPGAKDAKVAEFIDQAMESAFDEEERSRFMEGFKAYREQVNQDYSNVFVKLNSEQQQESISKLANSGDPFWAMLKSLVMVGYFTSEIGAQQALEYIPIPGPYEGCKPMAANQKAWISYP